MLVAMFSAALIAGKPPVSRSSASTSPIRHVVVIVEENHSFNDILGKFCAEVASGQIIRAGVNDHCNGATQATISDGSSRELTIEPDYGLKIDHTVRGQRKALDAGKMDGWDKARWCTPTSPHPYACLSQFDPLNGTCGVDGHQNCTPNLDLYAEQFALSDRTFEFRASASWAGHMVLASASVEHFEGDIPTQRAGDPGGAVGWGCDSGTSATWFVNGNSGRKKYIPSCIPDQTGSLGPVWAGYSGTRASYVPTIFDRMDAAALPWKIYYEKSARTAADVGWAICPTFWECKGGSQNARAVSNKRFIADAAGSLPALSFLIPGAPVSTHQPSSVSAGDAWVGKMVNAVMTGPNWSSTAIFITFDDCGCFYDDVNPLQYSADWGPRVPMLIVSPYAKPGYTDSTPATSASLLTFIEQTFGLDPLHPCATQDAWDPHCTDDAQDFNGQPTYDFSNAFDFAHPQARRVPLVHVGVPPPEKAWLAAHPHAGDQPT